MIYANVAAGTSLVLTLIGIVLLVRAKHRLSLAPYMSVQQM